MKKTLLAAAMLSSFGFVLADENKIKQLEEQIKALQQQIEELKKEKEEQRNITEAIKEEVRNLKLDALTGDVEYKSYYGLGPAASKALINKKGVSIGGYGELTYVSDTVGLFSTDAYQRSKNSLANAQRLILYIGYAFNEKLKFNSELELEHASTSASHGTGGGYFKSELAFIDYNINEKLGLRAGLLLMPVGIINEYHEPPTFLPAQRPFLDSRIIPTTWEEMGAGVYGRISNFEYRFYITNGLMLKGAGSYQSFEPMKHIRQRGARAVADRYGITGKVEYYAPYNLRLGLGFWTGDVQSRGGSDSNLGLRRGSDVGDYTIVAPELWWQYAGFDIRAVYTYVNVGDAERMSRDLFGNSIQNPSAGQNIPNILPSKQQAYYLQVGYDVLRFFDVPNQELYIFGMYENLDTHKEVPSGFIKPPGHKVDVYNIGFAYRPHPLVALKGDYVKLKYNDTPQVKTADPSVYRFTIGFMF